MTTQEKIEEMVDGYNVDKTLFRLDLEVLVALAQRGQIKADYENFIKKIKD